MRDDYAAKRHWKTLAIKPDSCHMHKSRSSCSRITKLSFVCLSVLNPLCFQFAFISVLSIQDVYGLPKIGLICSVCLSEKRIEFEVEIMQK